MTESLLEVVSEVVAFARLIQQQSFTKMAIADYEFRPARSFYDILRDGVASECRAEDYRATVQNIVSRRQAVLRSAGLIASLCAEVYDGRVLATDLTSTMYDGVAGELTGGYFDHADAPPPETWLAVRSESVESPDFNHRVFLLSWVPHADVDRVNIGIESTPSGCLSWVENWQSLAVDS